MKKRFIAMLTMLALCVPMLTTASFASSTGDNDPGTLRYDYSADGSKVTISYDVNGQKVSYTVPNQANYTSGALAGTDDLNRTLSDAKDAGVYGSKGDRYVGLFYFMWLGEHGDDGIFDISKILATGGEAAKSVNYSGWGPVGSMHFFAEPLYGYYYSSDLWVVQKHMELLCNAGVDFLYFDVTNGFPYVQNALQVMSVLHNLNAQGFRAPKVVFYTNTQSKATAKQIYEQIYAANQYSDTWFYLDGKPLIIAQYEDNVNDFFTIRQPQWPNEAQKTNAWPWMDFSWPQRLFSSTGSVAEAISVSLAQHSGNLMFSTSAIYGYNGNRGRSSTGGVGNAVSLDSDSYKSGANFQEQFDRAIDSGAKYILVTGWNEWVAQRQEADFVMFVDTATPEYSRDIEMTRGYYFDNYYMQLVENIRRVKGTAPTIVQDMHYTIDLNGDFSQWNKIPTTYQDPAGDAIARYASGFGNKTLTNRTNRNDIVAAKVVTDSSYVYFYVECQDNITARSISPAWMQLFLNTDGKSTGWYGYDYIVNYRASSDTATTVAKYSGTNGAFGFTSTGSSISYRRLGKQMMIAVPLSVLGYSDYRQVSLQFKWVDSNGLCNTMEHFYTNGDVAPLGRLNWVYQDYIPGTSAPQASLEITSQPVSFAGAVDQTATFKVVASGSSLTYQWQAKAPGGTWKDTTLSGCKTSTLTVKAIAAREGYAYRCIIKDASNNSVTSAEATLGFASALQITAQPSSYTGAVDQMAAFTVAASGSGLTYQWQAKAPGGTWKDTTLSGCRTSTLSVKAIAAREGYTYRCVIHDESGNSVTSAEATLNFAATLQITAQPTSFAGAVDQMATFTVAANGSGLTYQWQSKAPGSSEWKNTILSGYATPILSVKAIAAREGYAYRCIIHDESGDSVTSAEATLGFASALRITSQPTSYTGAVDQTATFTVAANGSSLTYQWQSKAPGSSEWKNTILSGYATPTLTVKAIAAREGYAYRCIICDESGNSVTSAEATLGFAVSLQITAQPSSYVGAVDQMAAFTVTVNGSALTYQWQAKAPNGVWKDTTLSGCKTATLSVKAIAAREGYTYRCIIKDGSGSSVTSAEVTLNFSATLQITAQPTSFAGAVDQMATFTVAANGSGLTYQWQAKAPDGEWKNTILSGYKTPILSVKAIAPRNGYTYRCIINDSNGNSVTSAEAVLSIGA